MSNTPTTTSSRIYIVDDDMDLLRTTARLLTLLEYEVRTYACVEEFTGSCAPGFDAGARNCMLLDVGLPGMDGISGLTYLKMRGYDFPIVIMTGAADIPKAVAALRSGAFHFLEKPTKKQLLLETIENALAQDAREQRLRQLRREYQQRIATLSAREHEVLQLMLIGQSNKVIADKLGISIQTTAKHTARVIEKTQVSNIVELINLRNQFQSVSRGEYP